MFSISSQHFPLLQQVFANSWVRTLRFPQLPPHPSKSPSMQHYTSTHKWWWCLWVMAELGASVSGLGEQESRKLRHTLTSTQLRLHHSPTLSHTHVHPDLACCSFKLGHSGDDGSHTAVWWCNQRNTHLISSSQSTHSLLYITCLIYIPAYRLYGQYLSVLGGMIVMYREWKDTLCPLYIFFC